MNTSDTSHRPSSSMKIGVSPYGSDRVAALASADAAVDAGVALATLDAIAPVIDELT